jgi:hypothetical protein
MAQSFQIAATAVQVAGTIISAQAQANQARMEGKSQQQIAEFQARQMQTRAGQERAVSQMQAVEERRRARLARSKALAIAGASGGGTGGTVNDILSDLTAEGELNAQAALYEGEEAARGLEMQAAGTRAEGKYANAASRYASRNIKNASYLSAAGTTMQGAASFYSKYWPQEDDTVLSTNTTTNSNYTGGGKFGKYSTQSYG